MPIELIIVDDEELIRWTLKEALQSDNYRVLDFADGASFLKHFEEKGGDIVMLDIRLPDINGLEILSRIKQIDPGVFVVIMTAFAEIDTAVTAMKQGAYDYITKPYNLSEVSILIKKIVETSILKSQLRHFQERDNQSFNQILGESIKIKRIKDHILMAAQSERTTVLVRGESGTGKELVARQIHLLSSRKTKPFIDINAAAVTGTLLESELFGHEKGAFTDAHSQKKGFFELADSGTLFFDEIGDLSPSLQAKLLRVLQEKRFRRVGGSNDITVDVRIIAATNADLEKQMEEGSWRKDLFYRLNVFTIFLPPLRERKDDIVMLAKFFLEQFCCEFSKNITGFSSETMDILMRYPYPGNVRELKNLIERATLLESTNKIRPASLPDELKKHKSLDSKKAAANYSVSEKLPTGSVKPWKEGGFSIKDYIDKVEGDLVKEVLVETNGNKGLTAKILGLTRFSLRHLIKKHCLEEGASEESV
ncbi:MAG: sigma-54-dependent Fis family transcriptional regulator [Candidatus Riflebacteria bacterium]|nr:sigma-54-dependent Fis family transcriptional regulator [Candidatus Riflebacteria bacterium]